MRRATPPPPPRCCRKIHARGDRAQRRVDGATLSFDASSGVRVTKSLALAEFTIEVWAKLGTDLTSQVGAPPAAGDVSSADGSRQTKQSFVLYDGWGGSTWVAHHFFIMNKRPRLSVFGKT